MTKNIVNTALVLLGTGSLLAGCNVEQPDPGCFVQESPHWAVKYDQVEAGRDAAGDACDTAAPPAEMLGVYRYIDLQNGTAKLALRPQGLASRGPADESTDQSEQTALGDLATDRDAEDFCGAPSFPAARVRVASSGNEIVYQYANVRVYSAPSAPGTQLTGELTYTNNGCTSKYVVNALWPAVGCDPEVGTAETNCGPGSGLNPDFNATCVMGVYCGIFAQPDLEGCCVPTNQVPSFK
ncbi:hypothetical protein HV824_24520 [Myxococcus sp. AM009]|uniref:hypothetical protein n=1 Tax=unclassified Myxococcus TaxID=2648731 RepID=UPI0015953A0D|nr:MULTISPECIES: hypothetical protein [unclassified Myxococcus]NVJ01257.1 hypothetical protein [Myxococcus sp. AM009]NVJ13800.1 hypothetical protein [Myxococcus sp. AM010]